MALHRYPASVKMRCTGYGRMIIAMHSEVHSAGGECNETLLRHRPFRVPHHSVSTSGLTGCASNLRMQMLTIEDLLHDGEVKMPPQYGTFMEATRARMGGEAYPQLDL